MNYQDCNEFENVYERYADMLYRLALSYLNSSSDAEDVLQDVFLRYLKKMPAFKSEEHERAWFVRVTINRCHDVLRSRKFHLSLDEVSQMPDKGKEDSFDLLNKLSVLSEKYKTVIILHYLEGYSVEEVSFMLGLSLSAVKMRLSRGKKLLRNVLSKEENHV